MNSGTSDSNIVTWVNSDMVKIKANKSLYCQMIRFGTFDSNTITWV